VQALTRIASAGGVDGVAIECIASPDVTAAVEKCFEAGIPVVTFGTDCQVALKNRVVSQAAQVSAATGRQSFIGSSANEIGAALGHRLVTALGREPKGTVVVISTEHPNFRAVEEVVVAYLKSVRGLSVKGPERVGEDPAAVTQALTKALGEDRSVIGWVILNSAAVPTGEAAPLAAAAKMPVVVLSSNPTAMEAVGDRVSAAVIVPYLQYGEVAVQMLDGLTRERRFYTDVYPVPLTVVHSAATLAKAKTLYEDLQSGKFVAPAASAAGPKPLRKAEPEKKDVPVTPVPAQNPEPAPSPAPIPADGAASGGATP
jgi:ABC-type sugar transport system substrate-binding protein